MPSPRLGLGDQTGFLQAVLDPGVALRAVVLAIPGVEVLHTPPRMALAIGIGQPHHLIHRRFLVGNPLQSPIHQTLQTQGFITRQITPKGPLTNPWQTRRFRLRQSTQIPPRIRFFKSHLPDLL